MGGTNDILMGRDARYCLKKLDEIVLCLQAKGAQVCIGMPPPIDVDLYDQDSVVVEYNALIDKYAKEKGIGTIDFYQPLHQASASNQVVYAGDVHPNQVGYHLMYQAAATVLIKMLSE